MQHSQIKKGTICRHHKGNIYTILGVLNNHGPNDAKFPHMVHYLGANGLEWTRSSDEFVEKFTVIFDGTQKA